VTVTAEVTAEIDAAENNIVCSVLGLDDGTLLVHPVPV
jgi:hypothetical protein